MNFQEYATKIDLFFEEIKSFEYKYEFDYIHAEKNEFKKLLKEISDLSIYYNIKGALVSTEILLLWYIPYNYIINEIFKIKNDTEFLKNVKEYIYGTFTAMINDSKYFNQDKLFLNRVSGEKIDIFLNEEITNKYIFLISVLLIPLLMQINIFDIDDTSFKFINDYIYQKIQSDINFSTTVKILCKNQ